VGLLGAWLIGRTMATYGVVRVSAPASCFVCFSPPALENLHRPRALRIVDLTSRFVKLLAGLGFYPLRTTGFAHASSLSLMEVQNPPMLPAKFRPCRTTSWSLVRRLANRISELSAAKARVEGWKSLTGFVTIDLSREGFEQGRLSELKISHQISDSSHVAYGPKDANGLFWTDGGAVNADRITWPLTYRFHSLAAQADPVARAPCKHCGLVFYSDQDLSWHEHCHPAYAYADT